MIERALAELRRGYVVGLPTETVYGLAADARRADAVEMIFALKGRPSTNPLIVHVADTEAARRCAADWPAAAEKLAAAFWPGPLTIVVRRNDLIPPVVTAGGPTVGLRVPAHPLALDLLRRFDGPLAAPSANRSNRVSPTTARHVRDEFGDSVPVVLDGGPCRVGIESTVVDVTGDLIKVLRPGHITLAQIEAVLRVSDAADSQTFEELTARAGASDVLKSPGQFPVHYAPRTPAYRFEAHQRQGIDLTNAVVLEPTLDAAAYARNLYARLRLLDTQDLDAIYIELPPDVPAWAAVRDRLLRATRPLPRTP
ncbi:MAG TPA: L-threonylcarbamoyladenylate synthase [Tepidisphaeraceae bacterium]|jgi:L-threonylcarbamoyladenylate synthase